MLIVQSKDFLVQGKAQDANELYISVGGGGDELIPIGESGLWQKTILLGPGDNTIRVRAKKFLGRETEVVRHIIFEEPASDKFAPNSSAPTPAPKGLRGWLFLTGFDPSPIRERHSLEAVVLSDKL